MRESKIEREVCQYVKQRGGQAVKLNSDSCIGLPDRMMLLPSGKVVFIEFKRPGGRVSPLQLLWVSRLHKLGHSCHVVDSIEHGKDLVDLALLKVRDIL